MALALNGMGISHVYLTLGADGVVHGDQGQAMRHAALPAQVVNASGSGDAFFAGIIHANAMGRTGSEAVAFGLEMAKMTLEMENVVNNEVSYLYIRPTE